MKKFIFNLVRYFFLMILCIIICFLLFAPQFADSYTASVADKINRLESIQEPKIVLVGNSNLAFGMDSSMLEEALGMPVVNLGLHGGLGNLFHYNMAKRNIAQGDIVILANTDFDDGLVQDPPLAWITIENGDDFWTLIPEENRLDMLVTFPNYVVDTVTAFGIGRSAFGMYSRKAFNKYGDNVSPREEGQMSFSAGSIHVPDIETEAITQINEFNAFCNAQGAVCLMAAYPVASGIYTPPAEEYRAFQEDLISLLDCEVISDYTDYFFDYEYFYDTQYHLTNAGAKLRTQQLIEDLIQWQESRDA